MRILIIEDDQRIAANLREMLTAQSYAVDICHTVSSGQTKAQSEDYDLLIIDWMLPDGTGPDIIKALRQDNCPTPVLMLTAKSQPEDVVDGLNSGADDYLPKPFQMDELLARVRALLRRPADTVPSPVIRLGDLIIDTNLHLVSRADLPISLSPREFALLEYLARHANQSLNRLDLLSHVWDENVDAFSNTVDVHIRYLRRKIDDNFTVKLIHTVKGKGYVLRSP